MSEQLDSATILRQVQQQLGDDDLLERVRHDYFVQGLWLHLANENQRRPAVTPLTTFLASVRERLSKATPGPWMPCLGSGNNECTGILAEQVGMFGKVICDLLPDYILKDAPKRDISGDRELIANTPSDLAKLIAIVEIQADTLAAIEEYSLLYLNEPESSHGCGYSLLGQLAQQAATDARSAQAKVIAICAGEAGG